jgi:hypothetical protein
LISDDTVETMGTMTEDETNQLKRETALLELLRRSRGKPGVQLTVENFRAAAGLVLRDVAEVYEIGGELRVREV